MTEIIEVENYIDAEGKRYLHLMSNEEIKVSELEGYGRIPAAASVSSKREAGVWHFRAGWLACGPFAGTLRGSDRREKQIVLWSFVYSARVSQAIRDGAREFGRVFGRLPHFAAVRSYPEAMGLDPDIQIDGGCVALVESKDVLDGFVMLF